MRRDHRAALAPIALLVALAAIAAYQFHPWSSAAAQRPALAAFSASAKVDIGVTTAPLARNAWRRWSAASLVSVYRFERAAHKPVGVVMWYADWAHSAPDLPQLRAIAAAGAVPEITWEPWNSHLGLYSRQPSYSLASIVAGRHDAYIRRWAVALARYGRTVRLRFAQEMNGTWYPWDEPANGNRPGQFVAAWRHVHAIFTAAGASNVEWVWSPMAAHVKAEEYPGSTYVDIVGLSGFVGGPDLRWARWRSFQTAFGPGLAALARIAPGKPVEISEVAVSERGGSKASWIRGMFGSLAKDREITSIVWFNIDKGSSWMIQSSAAAERAFAAGAAAKRYR